MKTKIYLWMMKKISLAFACLLLGMAIFVGADAKKASAKGINAENSAPDSDKKSLRDALVARNIIPEESLWDSNPEEISEVNIQILDKISGKVFRQKLQRNEELNFGTICVVVKRMFKNPPDDDREIYAYVVVYENGRAVFSDWLFASAPAVNLFSHAVYDVRVEF